LSRFGDSIESPGLADLTGGTPHHKPKLTRHALTRPEAIRAPGR
jgi:hypothetical protein